MEELKKCDVCKKDVILKKFKTCKCKYCGWVQSKEAIKNPNNLTYPNITSLNHAKELVCQGKKILPSFEDFIESVRLNLEPNFKYKKKIYGNTNFDGYEFFEWNKEEGYQSYKSIEDFAKNVNIDGKSLKDIWDDIYQFELGC